MSFFSKLLDSNPRTIADPVEAIGNVFDKLFTSDEERQAGKVVLEKLYQKPHVAQIELSKLEAQHRSAFVAGWRPAIGWTCALGLFFTFIVNPVLQWYTGDPGPGIPSDVLMELVIAMLGLAGLRSLEKERRLTK